jgi:hypothetical protein
MSDYYYPYGAPLDTPIVRPARPTVVMTAVVLTYVGVALSGLKAAAELAMTLNYRDDIVRLMREQGQFSGNDSGFDRQTFLNAYITAIPVAFLMIWLLAGAGAVICAMRSARGSNGARLTLAVLSGLFVIGALCMGFFTTMSVLSNHENSSVRNLGVAWTLASIGGGVVLAGIALTVLVLLFVPKARRYFTPGPQLATFP